MLKPKLEPVVSGQPQDALQRMVPDAHRLQPGNGALDVVQRSAVAALGMAQDVDQLSVGQLARPVGLDRGSVNASARTWPAGVLHVSQRGS